MVLTIIHHRGGAVPLFFFTIFPGIGERSNQKGFHRLNPARSNEIQKRMPKMEDSSLLIVLQPEGMHAQVETLT